MISEEIIKVLEYLGEQMGIAVDWTSANVLPYIETFLRKYVHFNIINSSIYIIVSLIISIGCIFLWKHMRKSYNNGGWVVENGYSTVMSVSGIFAILGSISAFVAFVVVFFVQVSNLVRWACVPELMILKEVSYLISN